MGDKELEKLYGQQMLVELQIKKRKSDIGKANGEVVGSIDELVCKRHKEGIFKVIGKIDDSSRFNAKNHFKNLQIYRCEKCHEDRLLSLASKAYDCPSCGIVLGEYEKQDYNEISCLAGTAGVRYYCRICDSQLGESVTTMS